MLLCRLMVQRYIPDFASYNAAFGEKRTFTDLSLPAAATRLTRNGSLLTLAMNQCKTHFR
jgi:hypothetical protein